MTHKRLLDSICSEASEQALAADLERARDQAVWLMQNCANPDCPIGCPPEHADLGFPEVNCGTFRLIEADAAVTKPRRSGASRGDLRVAQRSCAVSARGPSRAPAARPPRFQQPS